MAAPRISTFGAAVRASGVRPTIESAQAEKKNYAERFSRNLATLVANGLRPSFPGVVPNADGSGQEAPTPSAGGYKKLDVGVSSVSHGLELGVSIKTVTLPDPSNGRYGKNYTRIDNELRSEALGYHRRQPYSVLVAILFLPLDSCDDGSPRSNAPSSFGSAVRHFRGRAGRYSHADHEEKFEGFFICLYDLEDSGSDRYFDVMKPPPRRGRPSETVTFDFLGLIEQIQDLHIQRNSPPFVWSDGLAPDEPGI
jgi:hypothetical protein